MANQVKKYSLEQIYNFDEPDIKRLSDFYRISYGPNSLLNKLNLSNVMYDNKLLYQADEMYIKNKFFKDLYLRPNLYLRQTLNRYTTLQENNDINHVELVKKLIDIKIKELNISIEYLRSDKTGLSKTIKLLGFDSYPMNTVDLDLIILALYRNKNELSKEVNNRIEEKYGTLSYEALEFYGDRIINYIMMTPLMGLFSLDQKPGIVENLYYFVISNSLFNNILEYYGICTNYYKVPNTCLKSRSVEDIKQYPECRGRQRWKLCADHLEALVGALHYWNTSDINIANIQINIYDWLLNLEPVIRFYSMMIEFFPLISKVWRNTKIKDINKWDVEYPQLRYSIRREILKIKIPKLESRFIEKIDKGRFNRKWNVRDENVPTSRSQIRNIHRGMIGNNPSIQINYTKNDRSQNILDKFQKYTDIKIERKEINYKYNTTGMNNRLVYMVYVKKEVRKIGYSNYYPDYDIHVGFSIQEGDKMPTWNQANSELINKLIDYFIINLKLQEN